MNRLSSLIEAEGTLTASPGGCVVDDFVVDAVAVDCDRPVVVDEDGVGNVTWPVAPLLGRRRGRARR